MAQRVEDINGLVQLINSEKAEIINKVNELNQNEEINEILTVSLPQIEELINSKYTDALEQFSALNSSLDNVLSAQDSLSKTAETEEFFSSLKTDVNNFYSELLNQHNFLESVRQKLNDMTADKSDRDEVIKSVVTIKSDMENFNRSLESYVIDINTNLQNILRHILTMDTTEQNDIIKRELENIFLSSNAILSSLEISDKKDEEMYNVISSVENKIDELIGREPINAVKAINDLRSTIDEKFNKTSSEISKVGDNFKSLSTSNLEQILTDIGASSAKIDELSAVIQEDFAQNLSSIKSLVENISIDTPSISPENPALSGKLEDILKAINNIEIPEIPAQPDYDIEQNINALKNSLGSITEILNDIKISGSGETAEKLTALEAALSEGIRHYDDNLTGLNNKLNEYITSINQIKDLTDEKLDSSINGISDVKLQLKGLVEALEVFNSKSDVRLETSLESFKAVDETIREKLDEITNTLRISGDSAANKFETVNESVTSNFAAVNEKLDNISSTMDARFEGVKETLNGTTSDIGQNIGGKISEAVDVINQNNVRVTENLENLSSVLEERLSNVRESLNETSNGMNSVIENTGAAIKDNINVLNDNIIAGNDRVNEKLDNITSALDEKFTSAGDALTHTSDGLQSVVETTGSLLKENINLLNENISERNDKVNEKLDGISSAMDEKFANAADSLSTTAQTLQTVVETTGSELKENVNLLNENISERNDKVNEKLDGISSAMDEKFANAADSLSTTAQTLQTVVETTGSELKENINLLNANISERNDKVNEKLDGISSAMDEKFAGVSEAMTLGTDGLHTVVATTGSEINGNINLINENIIARNEIVNEKLDNITSTIDEKFTGAAETLVQTSDGLNNVIENTGAEIQNRVNTVNENLTSTGVQINEKLDNVTSIVSENLNSVSEFLTQTSESLNTFIDTTNVGVQDKVNLVNETLAVNNEKLNEKFDNFTADVDAKLNSVSGTLNLTSNAISSAISSTEANLMSSLNTVSDTIVSSRNDISHEIQNINTSILESIGNIFQNTDNTPHDLDEKLDAVTASFKEQLQSVDESISAHTANLNAVSENVNTSIQNGINTLSEELKTNSDAIGEKLDDVTSAINTQLTSVNDTLNTATETLTTKVENMTGDLLEQLQNANEKIVVDTTDINAAISDMNLTMKDSLENINTVLSTNVTGISEKTENIESVLREQLGAVNSALADNIEHINSLLGDVNSTVESKLGEINSDVKLNVDSIKECFDSALSALDMVRTDIVDNIAENNDSLSELVNNTIKEIKALNTGNDDDMQEKFTNLREHILAVILELQSRQEEIISIAKRSDERNLLALDDITATVKNVETALQTNANAYKQLFEEKMTELKTDVEIIRQLLSSEGGDFNEKLFNKLFTVEALINEVSDKYEEKLITLSSNITTYINTVEKNNEDAEIKLGNSVAEISEIRNDLQRIADDLNTVENNQDVKFYELTENINSKIEEITANIAGMRDIVQDGVKGDVKQNLAELDVKFEQLFSGLNKIKELTPDSLEQSILELEEKLGAVKQEINLVNTDILDAIDTKSTMIIEGFAPVREAVSQILDFDFNKIITEVKTQVELSYLNLTSDLNSSLTMSQEALTKLEHVFKDVAQKIIAIDNQMTDFSRNNLEILNITIENINKVAEKNLDETTNLSLQWKAGIEAIEEKIAAASEQYDLSLKNYMDNFKEELQKNIDTNFENIKSFVSVIANEDDALHSIDILKTELSNRMEILTDTFREEFAKSSGQAASIQQFSTDLKSYIDKILVNFAKHIETAVTARLNANADKAAQVEQIEEVVSKWTSNLNSDIIKEFDAISDKLSDLQTTINLNDTQDVTKNIQETLEALHEKVDVLAMSDDSGDDIIYEIEEIKNILTKVSGKSEEFNELLKEINKIEESSSKNANDIKESVMSAIIAVFDQISFVEESEDIKDFVEEKTDEINQNLKEVRNQLQQIWTGDSQEYSYTLQDVESDIAKLRMVLNEMSQSSSSDDVLEILDNIHKIAGSIDGLQASLTTDQIYDLKNDVERLNEDIVSISTRTNKLLLTSDESYKALNNGLDEFSKVILKLEERINILDNTKNSERIEKKLDNVNTMVATIANSSKVMNQVMMYLGEWIDTTSENIGAISEKTAEIDEIKEIITDLRDTIPSKSAILNELENRFEEQQQRLDRLEMKFDRVLALLEDRDDARLNKKFERMEKQMTKLSMNIEKLASYVDE